jgi:hypothetical protein
VLVSNISLAEYDGDFDSTSDTISFDGIISLAAKAVGNDGQQHDIGFSANVSASADFSWESDEHPTGWNHKTDSPTYTSTTYAAAGEVTIHLLEPDEDTPCYYDNEEVPMETLQQNLPLATQKQLLNPSTVSRLMEEAFQAEAEKMEAPSEDDYAEYEPDEYYDNDRDY